MDSENELLCFCCCDKTEEKSYKKEEKTGYGDSGFRRFTEKERNMAYHIYVANQMRIDNRKQYFK